MEHFMHHYSSLFCSKYATLQRFELPVVAYCPRKKKSKQTSPCPHTSQTRCMLSAQWYGRVILRCSATKHSINTNLLAGLSCPPARPNRVRLHTSGMHHAGPMGYSSCLFPNFSFPLPQDKRSDDLLPTGCGWQWINSVQANLKSEAKSKHLSLPVRADVPHHLCVVFGSQSTAKECSEIFEWNATKKHIHSGEALKVCLEAAASVIFCFVE